MNRSLRRKLFRDIRGSITRFLSIFTMVALGTMFLVGLRSAAPDMRKTADDYFDGQDFMDVQILSTLGLTEEDIEAFSRTEGVETAEGGWSLDAILTGNARNMVVKALSLPEQVNTPVLVEGKLPEAKNECAVEEAVLTYMEAEIGDTVSLSLGENAEGLAADTFTITGVVESPLYLSIERGTSSLGDGSVDAFVLLPRGSFDLEYYTVCDIRAADAAEMDAYSEEYQEKIDAVAENLTTLAEERGEIRYQALVSDAQGKVDEARTELEDARQKAEEEFDSAQSELDKSRQQLDEAKKQLEEAKTTLEQSAAFMSDEALAAARTQLEQQETERREGEESYRQGLTDLESARQEAEEEFSDAQREIDEAQADVNAIQPADVYVLDRNSNYGFVSYDQNAQRMDNLAGLFPVIFFIVAALVCLTTMTRMVEEQRTEIGSIKAMGYGTGAIAMEYLLYGAAAALGGGIVGAAIGSTLIPWVIFTSYNVIYNLSELHLELYWPLAIGAVAAGLVCTAGATLWAMLTTARETPAALMRPKAPQAGKRVFLERITPLWKRFSFSIKVSCRNLLRYKKRFWMTVIGIAGCTALMIAGLGLRSCIFSIIDVQFWDIYRYELQISLDTEDAAEIGLVTALLEEDGNVSSTALTYTKTATISANGAQDGYLMVTDDPEALYREIDLRRMKDGSHVDIPKDGVLIDQKLSELLDIEEGDEIQVECGGQRVSVPVKGILEHYVRHYVYMDAALYTELFDRDYLPNGIMVSMEDTSDEAISALAERLMAMDSVSAAANISATAADFEETLNAVNAAVTVIILSAAALAFVVLYNLTNINITERIRELATIKVLGFYDLEVAMYIYRENIVLTILGIALGQLFGNALCRALIRTIELDIVMFGRSATTSDYLGSIFLSLLFAVLVNTLMFFRMRKIDMVQSLKSVE